MFSYIVQFSSSVVIAELFDKSNTKAENLPLVLSVLSLQYLYHFYHECFLFQILYIPSRNMFMFYYFFNLLMHTAYVPQCFCLYTLLVEYSFLAFLHFFFSKVFLSLLYYAPFLGFIYCLFFIYQRISSVINFLLFLLEASFWGMSRSFLNVLHFESVILTKLTYIESVSRYEYRNQCCIVNTSFMSQGIFRSYMTTPSVVKLQ